MDQLPLLKLDSFCAKCMAGSWLALTVQQTFSLLNCDDSSHQQFVVLLDRARVVEFYHGWQVVAWAVLFPLCLCFPPPLSCTTRRHHCKQLQPMGPRPPLCHMPPA